MSILKNAAIFVTLQFLLFSQGMEEPAGKCAPGWYCTLGAFSSQPQRMGNYSGDLDCNCPANVTGGMCYAGSYCPEGSSFPVPCDPGKYCQTDELDAPSGDCMAGHYCSGSTIVPDPVGLINGMLVGGSFENQAVSFGQGFQDLSF